MSLGSFLRESRLRAGLTQAEVSRHFGWSSPQYWSNIEREVSNPPLHILKDLCKMMKIPPKAMSQKIVESYRKKIKRSLK